MLPKFLRYVDAILEREVTASMSALQSQESHTFRLASTDLIKGLFILRQYDRIGTVWHEFKLFG